MVEVTIVSDKAYVIDNEEDIPRTLFIKLSSEKGVAQMLRIKEGHSPINIDEQSPIGVSENNIIEVVPVRYFDNHPELLRKAKVSRNYGNYVFRTEYDEIFSK